MCAFNVGKDSSKFSHIVNEDLRLGEKKRPQKNKNKKTKLYFFLIVIIWRNKNLCMSFVSSVCADEMTSQRDVLATTENSLAAFVTSALPNSGIPESPRSHLDSHSDKVGTVTTFYYIEKGRKKKKKREKIESRAPTDGQFARFWRTRTEFAPFKFVLCVEWTN